MSSIAGTALNFAGQAASVPPQQRQAALREAAQELVGSTFYGEMLKVSRSNPFKSKMFHGGRGEEMFQAQLDAELARRMGGATKTDLADAIVKRLSHGSADRHGDQAKTSDGPGDGAQ